METIWIILECGIVGGLVFGALGTLIAIIWMCVERRELPWHFFGKSSTK